MHRKKKKACKTGKQRFATMTEAERFITRNNSGPGLFLLGNRLERSYKCEHCYGWHATTETLEQYQVNLEKAEGRDG